MTRDEKKALKKELGNRKIANRVRKLSRYEASTDLVSWHDSEMDVREMAAYVEFAQKLSNNRMENLTFSGLAIRRELSYDEKVNVVLEAENRKRRYGY